MSVVLCFTAFVWLQWCIDGCHLSLSHNRDIWTTVISMICVHRGEMIESRWEPKCNDKLRLERACSRNDSFLFLCSESLPSAVVNRCICVVTGNLIRRHASPTGNAPPQQPSSWNFDVEVDCFCVESTLKGHTAPRVFQWQARVQFPPVKQGCPQAVESSAQFLSGTRGWCSFPVLPHIKPERWLSCCLFLLQTAGDGEG